jgi:Mrp family chromosome partitioning ATPase
LPTPPLPEATAIIFLTSGRISTPFCVEYLAIFVSILTLTSLMEGAKVALLDADIYGPSPPRMLGVSKLKPEQTGEGKLLPILGHGMQSMSIGYLVDEEKHLKALLLRLLLVVQGLN